MLPLALCFAIYRLLVLVLVRINGINIPNLLLFTEKASFSQICYFSDPILILLQAYTMAKKKKQPQKKRDAIKLIVKSNELVEARYMFDAWENRFFHTLVSMVNKTDEDDKTYRIWFRDIKKLFNIKSNQSYDFLREAARSLNRKTVYIGWMNDEFKRGREYNLFEFVDYLEKGQKGKRIEGQEYVDVKIHPKMLPFLLHVKKNFDPKITRYTSYDLRNIEKLQPYGTRIYELFKQDEYRGYRELNIEELKARFLITNEYPRFSTLYQRVIKPSIKAINEHTDINIPVDKIRKIKEGRSVVALYFVIESKSKEAIAEMRGEAPELLLFDENKSSNTEKIEEAEIIEDVTNTDRLYNEFEEAVVKSFGVTPSVFLRLLNTGNYKREAVEQAIRVTRRAKFNQEIKKSVSGFFLKALKEGYTDVKEESRKKALKNKELLQKAVNDLKQLKIKFSSAVNKRIKEITTENEDITEAAILKIKSDAKTEMFVIAKEASIGRDLDVEDFRKDEQLRAMVIANIIEMQRQSFLDINTHFREKIKEQEKRIIVLKKRAGEEK